MRYNIGEGVDEMEKNATLNIRINPDVKKSAETVLSRLGVPMATAVDMFLKQITLTGGIPFAVTLPEAPESVNADRMSVLQLRDKLAEGLSDIEHGKVRSARESFKRFKENHPDGTL
jgi:addiction module RelB/DinJ family antitoxin